MDVEFNGNGNGHSEEVEVHVDSALAKRAKRKARNQERLAEARAFAAMGYRIISLKNKTYSALGDEIQKLGIKNIGHGKFAIASELSEEAISKLDALIEQKQHSDCELADLTDLMRLRKEYVALIMESGKAHIAAEKAVANNGEGNNLVIPFPAGTPMMVAVGKQNPIAEKSEGS